MHPYSRNREARQRDKETEHNKPKPFVFSRRTEAVGTEMTAYFLQPSDASQADKEVLQDAERTDDGAIRASDEQGEQEQQSDRYQ